MTVALYDLAAEIHGTAKEKGFWDSERNYGEMLMLIVSELAEALEAHRDGQDPVYYEIEGGKPEGAAIELADAVIRCLDTLYDRWISDWGSMDEKYKEFQVLQTVPTRLWPVTDNFGEQLLAATRLVTRATDTAIWLLHVIVLCEKMVNQMGWDIWGLARIKMDYNNTRPYKHGKAY